MFFSSMFLWHPTKVPLTLFCASFSIEIAGPFYKPVLMLGIDISQYSFMSFNVNYLRPIHVYSVLLYLITRSSLANIDSHS